MTINYKTEKVQIKNMQKKKNIENKLQVTYR